MNKYKILTLLFLLVSIGVESKADTRFLTFEEQQAQSNAELIEAAKQGDIQKVKKHVLYADINVQDNQGRTLVYLAAKYADINVQDNQGRTPLYWAAKNEHLEVVDVLLANGATSYYIRDRQAWQDLMLVANQEIKEKILTRKEEEAFIETAKQGDIERLQYFIDKGVDINARDKDDRTALYWAIQKDFEEVVDVLLDYGADVPIDYVTTNNEMHIKLFKVKRDRFNARLIEVAKQGDIQKVTAFVKRGADIDVQDNQGRTPLYWAAKNEHLEVVDVLLENGAASYYTTDNQAWKDLMLVVNQEIREKILKKREEYAFIESAKQGNIEILQYFIDKGVDINARDKDDRTYSLEESSSRNRYDQTALYWAEKNEHPEVVDVLLDNGVDVPFTFVITTNNDELRTKLSKVRLDQFIEAAK